MTPLEESYSQLLMIGGPAWRGGQYNMCLSVRRRGEEDVMILPAADGVGGATNAATTEWRQTESTAMRTAWVTPMFFLFFLDVSVPRVGRKVERNRK